MIEVRNVSKRFGQTVALDGVSFRLGKGEILGFLGPNGAGKSTCMKIITSFLAPDAGEVKVDGIDVLERPLEVRSRIGYLPENNPLYVDMNVREYLDFVGRARGLSGARLKQRLEWVTEACGIGNVIHKLINELSKGYRQRTGLAQALIHDPDVLILDEPTSGLDPLQIIGIRRLIQSLAHEKTIIFSTHILQEVSPVTDRVVIINDGRLVADGLIPELRRRAMGSARVCIGVKRGATDVAGALQALGVAEAVLPLEGDADAERFELRAPFGTDLAGPLGVLARERSWNLIELSETRFSLEDTFIALTRESHGGEVADV